MELADGVEVVVAADAEVGEGPVWDSRVDRIVWVDILARRIHVTDGPTGATDTIETPLHVGAVAPREAGGFVAALRDGFWVLGDGTPRHVASVDDVGARLRFNDGKCDPAGRFWAGTMAYDLRRDAAALYRLDADGRATRVIDGVSISNGLAWSPDGDTMYYIDTPTQRIDAFSFDPATGALSERRTAIRIPGELGAPDGMTVDVEGGLWVALWGGWAVHRCLHGRHDHVIELPISQPTSCAFGGENLDELFVTSAWERLSILERTAQPLAGALFRVRPGIRGMASAMYLGT